MTSNVTDRAAVRSQLATLLTTSLVGVGKPAEAVYAYQVGDFGKKSPVVVVTGAGTGRGNPLIVDPTDFLLEVHTFVLYATEDGSWTEQQSEDRLDLLEKSIGDVINQEAKRWSANLIVIGTQGRRGFNRLVLGSVAEHVIRLATKPVLIIRAR